MVEAFDAGRADLSSFAGIAILLVLVTACVARNEKRETRESQEAPIPLLAQLLSVTPRAGDLEGMAGRAAPEVQSGELTVAAGHERL